ncbi:MAG: hypothetical protein KKD63_06555 [Proteobacteria bacterium]|nr:hypothetical protein [Desulfobulbaceae bacterium]MBU4152522.1 hypothetical protein [Pseudomonadota bacterium]
MRFRKKHVCCMQLVLFWLGDVSFSEVHAGPMALSADWTYQDSSERAGHLAEAYTADYSARHDLTELMSMDTTLRATSRSDFDSTRQNVIPSLSYLINNDIFFFNLSGTANEEFSDSVHGDRSNRSLAANWNSAWGRQVWWLPGVNLNFNQNWQQDSLTPSLLDAESTNQGASLDWDLLLARVFYRYNTSESSNQIFGNEHQTKDQLARIETDASFWQGKGSVSLSQQIANVKTDSLARVVGGFALLPVSVSAYHGEAVPNPVTLSVNGALTDGDRDGVAVTVNNPVHPMNIGLRINFQQIDRIYLYTETALSTAISAQFTWDLYTSNNNIDWVLVQTSISGVYNTFEKRFEFVIPPQVKEFVKLVAVNDPAITAVNFTEIEAFQAIAASSSTVALNNTYDTYQTNASMNLQLRSDLQLTSNVAYMKNENSAGYDMTSTGVSSGLSWNPNPDWSVRVSGNQNSRQRTESIDDETRGYGVSVGFPTIPSVDSMVGVTLSEYYEGVTKTSISHNYTLQFIAELYRDLNGRLNFNVTQSDNLLYDNQAETVSTRVGLIARLVPGLVADWSIMVSDTSGQGSTIASDAIMTWRFTDILALRGNINGSWGVDDATTASASVDVGLTDTMQLSLTQRREFAPETSNISAIDWRWSITRYLSMMTSGAILWGGVSDEWNVVSRVNTRFTNF